MRGNRGTQQRKLEFGKYAMLFCVVVAKNSACLSIVSKEVFENRNFFIPGIW
jgi:hypothetical protein